MFQKNVKLGKPLKLSNWRKTSLGSYKASGDCQVYGVQKLCVSKVLGFLDNKSKATGKRITITHFMGRACAKAIEKNPQINALARLGRIYPREEINIFFQVAADQEGEELTGAMIKNINQKSFGEISDELGGKASLIKSGNDKEFQKIKSSMSLVPGIIIRQVIQLIGKILFGLNIWSPIFGMPKDNFGTMMISNVGSLGIEMAFAPLVDFTRTPLLLAVGAVFEDTKVVDGEIVADKFVNLCWTFDHRLIDGVVAGKISKQIRSYFESPELLD
jgi:pyruvate/2-oxoglutarate dehydrogenase complex dihydrolipoamide acyltransferase (E2) component